MAEEAFLSWLLPMLEPFGIYLAICVLIPPLFRKRTIRVITNAPELGALLRLVAIRVKLDLSRASGILLMPFRYLM